MSSLMGDMIRGHAILAARTENLAEQPRARAHMPWSSMAMARGPAGKLPIMYIYGCRGFYAMKAYKQAKHEPHG